MTCYIKWVACSCVYRGLATPNRKRTAAHFFFNNYAFSGCLKGHNKYMTIMSAQQKEDRLFENIYLSYFPKMKRFAQEYVISEQDAENIVQDMFAELWENEKCLLVKQSGSLICSPSSRTNASTTCDIKRLPWKPSTICKKNIT